MDVSNSYELYDVIDQIEGQIKTRTNKKKARQKAAKERKLKLIKSAASLLVRITVLVCIILVSSAFVLGWNTIVASLF